VRRDPPASDVAERVIGDLWQRGKIAQFSGRSSLRTWLGTVVAHTASNALKDARRSAPLGAASRRTPAESSGDADPAAHERFARLVAAELRALAPEDRLLLLFHYERAMSLQEIAGLLRSSKASLSRRLKRLREAVRVGIEDRLRSAVGTDSEEYRKGIDLGRVELDLASVLREAEPEQARARDV
jgi:RNA polymerase sigma factor (sigma-70 family)